MKKTYEDKRTPIWFIVVLTSLLTATAIVLVLILLMHIVSTPSLLQYSGFADSFLLKDPNVISEPYLTYALGHLVKENAILKLDDFWSFQSGFYQTLITVLIATNGILAALAFIFIKTSSHDKAIESAVEHTHIFLNGHDFSEKVKNSVEAKMAVLQGDYDSTANLLDEKLLILNDDIVPSVSSFKEDIPALKNKIENLERYVGVLTQRVADLDRSEFSESTLEIK
ncbi:hypothetical protein [Vibrio cholerae]|uniref:Uncharacterized protein n=5 Tax=Vibrio cholerae TaxID=666 RepID=A0A6B3LIP2_VIBCL|nr:hypothetical protein [Vibrio cholerae]AOY46154.1 hypothetical protein NH62_10935 [Vibrio cholerae]AOY49762.1 hypothetical protein AP033_10939 [Vibrio cholerae]EGR0377065.1 hypothetical protein [Vibrio cholerae]EHQ2335520.1 hypothetical protein [Vibrio cholerae]EJL6593079.1 hypothetical protein [Vibrio cholerae]